MAKKTTRKKTTKKAVKKKSSTARRSTSRLKKTKKKPTKKKIVNKKEKTIKPLSTYKTIQQTKSFIKSNPGNFTKLVALNILFWVALYYGFEVVNTIGESILPTINSDSISLFELIGLFIGSLGLTIVVPLLIYIIFRVQITNLLTNQKTSVKQILNELKIYGKVSILLIFLGIVYFLVLGMFHMYLIRYMFVITAIPLGILLYAAIQSLALTKQESKRLIKAKKLSKLLLKPILALTFGLIMIYAVITLLFYMFGGLWLSNFNYQSIAWGYITEYTILFNGSFILATIIWATVGQIYCAIAAHKLKPSK